jgi:hypothetical protein
MEKKLSPLSRLLGNVAGRPQPSIDRGRRIDPGEAPSPRPGKRSIMLWVDEAAALQITQIAFEQEISKAKFLRECLNLGFRKYGRPEIA